MKKRALSQAQLAALVWAGVLAPAAELLPGAALSAGRGAWLAPLAALPLALLSVWLLTRLARDRGLARGILDGLGPWLGRGVLLFYMVWELGLLALRLRLCAGRMLSSGYRDGALPYFLRPGWAAVSHGAGGDGGSHPPAVPAPGAFCPAAAPVDGGRLSGAPGRPGRGRRAGLGELLGFSCGGDAAGI